MRYLVVVISLILLLSSCDALNKPSTSDKVTNILQSNKPNNNNNNNKCGFKYHSSCQQLEVELGVAQKNESGKKKLSIFGITLRDSSGAQKQLEEFLMTNVKNWRDNAKGIACTQQPWLFRDSMYKVLHRLNVLTYKSKTTKAVPRQAYARAYGHARKCANALLPKSSKTKNTKHGTCHITGQTTSRLNEFNELVMKDKNECRVYKQDRDQLHKTILNCDLSKLNAILKDLKTQYTKRSSRVECNQAITVLSNIRDQTHGARFD